MQPTPGKAVFVRALVILNFDINCHFYTRHIYRSVIIGIGIGPEKRISVDPYTKLLKELLPVAEEPLLNIINSSLSLGHVPKPFKLVVIIRQRYYLLDQKTVHRISWITICNWRDVLLLPLQSKIWVLYKTATCLLKIIFPILQKQHSSILETYYRFLMQKS